MMHLDKQITGTLATHNVFFFFLEREGSYHSSEETMQVIDK